MLSFAFMKGSACVVELQSTLSAEPFVTRAITQKDYVSISAFDKVL